MSNFKNPFFKPEKKSIPLPRLRGNAVPRGKGWSWDLDIFVGEEYVASLKHPDDKPDFLTKEGAIADMKEKAEEASKTIAKGAYGATEEDIEDLKFFDFRTNSLVDQI